MNEKFVIKGKRRSRWLKTSTVDQQNYSAMFFFDEVDVNFSWDRVTLGFTPYVRSTNVNDFQLIVCKEQRNIFLKKIEG
jgi:hypothetical protein